MVGDLNQGASQRATALFHKHGYIAKLCVQASRNYDMHARGWKGADASIVAPAASDFLGYHLAAGSRVSGAHSSGAFHLALKWPLSPTEARPCRLRPSMLGPSAWAAQDRLSSSVGTALVTADVKLIFLALYLQAEHLVRCV